MQIKRILKQEIQKKLLLRKNKIIILYGARQVGKTYLIESILQPLKNKTLTLSGEEAEVFEVFSSRSLQKMNAVTSGYDILFIDEAQKIKDIGVNLKILHDKNPKLKIIATGSSAFELASSVREPLTGRTHTYHLYPVGFCEMHNHWNSHQMGQQVEKALVFGTYPELLSLKNNTDRQEYLHSLSRDYLYKDVLSVEGVRHSHKIRKLLQLLAYQLGNEVSLNELSRQLEIHKKTVEHYMDLLEKFFVIFPLTGLSRNLRKEVMQKPKIYFHDLGVRNAIINNFNRLENRNDTGMLWENFIISERQKHNAYRKKITATYFWRTYTGAELDYVEEYGGRLYGYEIKWLKPAPAPKAWVENYKAGYKCITRNNFTKFIT